MHKSAFFLLCLACASNGQRLQSTDESGVLSGDLARLLLALDPAAAFQPSGPGVRAPRGHAARDSPRPAMTTQLTRAQALRTALAAALAAPALPALADMTEAAERMAYANDVPKIQRMIDYTDIQLRTAVKTRDWPFIKAAFRPPNPKKKKDFGGDLTKTELYIYNWASSFDFKPKEDAMVRAADEMKECWESLALAAAGEVETDGFLFFKGSKKLNDSERAELAETAYKKLVRAVNKYITVGNDVLSSGPALDLIENTDV